MPSRSPAWWISVALGNSIFGRSALATDDKVPEHYKEADPLELPIPKAAQWLVHGTDDDIVPVEFARTYEREKIKSREDVHLQEIPKAGHFDLIDPRSPAWPAVEKTVLTCVGK